MSKAYSRLSKVRNSLVLLRNAVLHVSPLETSLAELEYMSDRPRESPTPAFTNFDCPFVTHAAIVSMQGLYVI